MIAERGRELSDFSTARPLLFNRPCIERHCASKTTTKRAKINVLLDDDG